MSRSTQAMRRWGAFAAGFALATAAVTVSIGALLADLDSGPSDGPEPARARTVALTAMRVLDNAIASIGASPGPEIVFLGDSLVVDALPPKDSAPHELRRALGPPSSAGPRIHDLSAAGLSLFSQYYLVERLARRSPDVVILSLNLAWFGPATLRTERREMAGWLPAARWPEATSLPLHRGGVVLSDLVWFRGIVAAGLTQHWQRALELQAEAAASYWRLARWLQQGSGMERGLAFRSAHRLQTTLLRTKNRRATPFFVRERLGPLLAPLGEDDGTLDLLGAWLAGLRDADVDVIVYAAPINVDHLEDLEIFDEAALGESIDRIGAVVRARGGTFIDLHARLRDDAFRDASDHLREGEGAPGARAIVRALLPVLRQRLRSRAAD